MSKVTELAKAEAEETESEAPAEESEQEEEGEAQETEAAPETPPETPPAAPAAPSSDAQVKAVEAELRRHERAWAKLVGVEPEDLNACDTCGGVGFTQDEIPPLLDSDFTDQCPKCNGIGRVKSHSANPDTYTIPCRLCQGYGYVPIGGPTEAGPNGAAEVRIEPQRPNDPRVEELRALGYTVFENPHVSAQ